MIVGLFRNNRPITLLFLPIAAIALWYSDFSLSTKPAGDGLFLYNWLLSICGTSLFVTQLVAVSLIIIGSILLYWILERNDILTNRNFLPSLMYIVLLSCSGALIRLHPALLANIFLILALNPLIALYRNEDAFTQVYNLGLFFGLAVLSYLPVLVLLPLIWIGLLIYHSFNYREWTVAIVGLLTPFLFLFTYLFWNDKLNSFYTNEILYSLAQNHTPSELAKNTYYLLIALLSLIGLSTIKVLEHSGSTAVKTGKTMSFLVWMIFFAFFTVLIMPTWTSRDFALMALPLSIFIGNYLSLARAKWMAELFFGFLLFSIILLRYF